MTIQERVAKQRALAREALGKLRAVEEYFGAEGSPHPQDTQADFEAWRARIRELESWVFEASPIA